MASAVDSLAQAATATLATVATSSSPPSAAALDQGPRNPILALIDGIIGIVLASLNIIRILVTFSTLTIPSTVYSILHYSLTLRLSFYSLLFLFIVILIAAFIWLRYRHLNRYERLREVPLTKDEGFHIHPDVAAGTDDSDRGSFHNYLDDFLQAIRIFGFLEKPVFHELARHLQTRRLVAGDSLSLDSDFSFYIVIDGHVQVFAPLPNSATNDADAFDDDDHLNGYQLLNEVESGGTLSSLFTILGLFTEDVKLGFGDEEEQQRDAHVGISRPSLSQARSRFNSANNHFLDRNPSLGRRVITPGGRLEDAPGSTSPFASAFNPPSQGAQLQLNAAALRNVPAAMTPEGAMERMGSNSSSFVPAHARTSSSSAGSVTVQEGDGDTSTIVDPTEAGNDQNGVLPHAPELHMPPAQAAAPFPHFAASSTGGTPGTPHSLPVGGQPPHVAGGTPAISHPQSPSSHARRYSTFNMQDGRPVTPGSIFSALGGGRPSDSMHREGAGTVARATVDTTLAVIPAEAFKRLTKKFPNAAAHIVQVILTRLSRVTFHTAHKYLGLTKEVMRTEKTINELACFPLSSEFYEKGGMEKLRHRFLPEPKKPKRRGDASGEDDYFRGYENWPTRSSARTSVPGSATASRPPSVKLSAVDAALGDSNEKTPHPSRSGSVSNPKTPWGHPDTVLMTPIGRSAVGPGDLLSMTGHGEDNWRFGPTPLSSAHPTPRSRPMRPMQRLDTAHLGLMRDPIDERSSASPRSGTSANSTNRTHGTDIFSPSEEDTLWSGIGLANFDLKNEVMDCIAKSIGLAQAPPSPLNSYQASPHISAQDAYLQRSVFKSAFGSLSMLDAAMGGDEESSITGTSSSLAGQNGGFHHTDFENEIEIKFYSAGSTLARAGESKAGLFYVIDGFLDVLLPPSESRNKDDDEDGDGDNRRGGNERTRKRQRSRSGTKSSGKDAHVSHIKSTNRKDADRLGADLSGAGARMPSERKRYSNDLSRAFNRPTESDKIGNALDGTLGGVSRPAAQPIQREPSSSSSNVLKRGRESHSGQASRDDDTSRSGRSRRKDQGENDNEGSASPGARRRDQPKPIFTVGRGGIAGYLSSLLGSASYVDIKARTDTYVGFLPASALERMMEKKPIVLLTLSKRLLSLLSPLILHIDSSLDWQQVNAGQIIYREGDASDSFYIVINGRLRAITEKENGSSSGVEVLSEYGQGDSVGELDVITNSRRRKTLHAIRDSELAKMPSTLFNAISVRHPAITIQISRIIARRVRAEMQQSQRSSTAVMAPVPGLPDLGRNNLNLKTVAIVPVTRQVPISDFADRLQTAFDDTIAGPTVFLNQSSVMGVLGRHAFSRMGKLKLTGWLADQEQKYRLVVYVVDTPVSSAWSQTSIRQADCVLLVGFGDDPTIGEYERLLLSIKTTARKELVLLHPERSVPPGATREWLKSRPWLHAHHHVEMPGISRTHAAPAVVDPRAVKALRNLKQKLETRLQQYKGGRNAPVPSSGRPHYASDFARLARRLCGKSIGLVLGGGGARGCAHLGAIRALEEKGIPIDMVGGTSIGSLIGGLYAREAELVSSYGRAKRFAGRMASLWRFASDLTYPVVSYTTGHEFNRGVFKAVQETHIEDMWIPFFCNTTNITWSRMEVHTTGYAWRYIRGSMTLAGLLPPLVDEGNMLVDGGYVDNLPVTVMMAMGARSVFAVDVGSIDDTSPRSYGDTLSGWWVLLNRWNPWSDARKIPSIPDIQGRLTYVSSVKTLEETKKVNGCFYMRMPVEGFGTLEFGKFDEISAKGYSAAQTMLDEWEREGRLPMGVERAVGERGRRRKGGVSARRNSV